MMQYPSQLKVGGLSFEVMLTKEPFSHPRYPDVRLSGATLMDQRKIIVWDNPHSPHTTEETVLHEMIEGIVDVYDLHFVDPSTGNKYAMPHTAIKTLGVALHQALAEGKFNFENSVLNDTTH